MRLPYSPLRPLSCEQAGRTSCLCFAASPASSFRVAACTSDWLHNKSYSVILAQESARSPHCPLTVLFQVRAEYVNPNPNPMNQVAQPNQHHILILDSIGTLLADALRLKTPRQPTPARRCVRADLISRTLKRGAWPAAPRSVNQRQSRS